MEIHFVCPCLEVADSDFSSSTILDAMIKYKIKKVMMTRFQIHRPNLITKEVMENYYKGEGLMQRSINDDLDSTFEDIRLGEQLNETVYTYFLPKLTEAELKLVERKDKKYMQTFWHPNADVDEAEMKLSESDSKYVNGLCRRTTFTIENSMA